MTRKASYLRVEEYLMDLIKTKKLNEGDRIPTVSELCEMFSVSEMTVHKALTHLADNQVIERIKGQGSFVKPFMVERQILKMQSFTEEVSKYGMKVSTKLICYSVVNSDKHKSIQEKLKLKSGDLIHCFSRLRLVDGVPYAYSLNYVSVNAVSNIDIKCLETSLYNYLQEDLGYKLGYNETIISVIPAEIEEVYTNLNLKKSSLVVLSAHVSYFESNVPFEYTETFYIPERYKFSYNCYRDNKNGRES